MSSKVSKYLLGKKLPLTFWNGIGCINGRILCISLIVNLIHSKVGFLAKCTLAAVVQISSYNIQRQYYEIVYRKKLGKIVSCMLIILHHVSNICLGLAMKYML